MKQLPISLPISVASYCAVVVAANRQPNHRSDLRCPGPNNAEPCLFLVGAGALRLTGYVRSLSLVDWWAALLLSLEYSTVQSLSMVLFSRSV